MKLYVVVLFACLSVGLQASARVIYEAGLPKEISEFIESAELEFSDDLPRGILNELREESAPEKCVPYIKPAYEIAVEIRRIFREGRKLLMKLRGEVMNCYALEKPADMSKCLDDVKKVAITEGKPLLIAYLRARNPVFGLLNKVRACLRNESEEYVAFGTSHPVVTFAARQCLPHVQAGFNRALQLREVTGRAVLLAWNLSSDYAYCERLEEEEGEAKMKCFHGVLKRAVNEGKPIADAYLNLRPHLIDIMDKFDKCMAA